MGGRMTFDLSDNPNKLEEELRDFYSNELKNEAEEYSLTRINREIEKRIQRAKLFYLRYKKYEQSGFDIRKIQEIFGLDVKQQQFVNYWLKRFVPHGLATTTYAEQGMGKTNLTSVLTEFMLVLKPQWDIISNISFAFSETAQALPGYNMPRIKIVGRMSQMLQEIAQTILNNRIPAVIIDEMDSSYIATQTRSNRGTSFKAFIYVERHFDTKGPFLIYHRHKDIPTEMRQNDVTLDTYQVTWYRNYNDGRARRVVSNPNLWENGQQGLRYFPVPLTSLPYMNQGFGSFAIDVDMQAIAESLNGTKQQAATQLLDLITEFTQTQLGRRRSIGMRN